MSVMLTQGAPPFTVADLETMPDDGRHYEIVDGVLIVSGDQERTARLPFPVTIRPNALLD